MAPGLPYRAPEITFLLIESSNTQLPIPALNAAPNNARSADAAPAGGEDSFEAQLSSALKESLKKLNAGAGEVNITIRNPSPTTRQILVTYSVEGEASSPAPATPASSQASAGNKVASQVAGGLNLTNPFSGYVAHVPPVVVDTPGPKDARDQMPAGGGKLTATGAPLIVNNETPAGNQYGYTGPAALNPYFTTPSNPLRDGYVAGFRTWFADAMILGAPNGPIPANKMHYATEEGAQEALRIVQQFQPAASVVQSVWQSGPYIVDKPLFEIDLGGGKRLNAGGLLGGYYNQGFGVATSSDAMVRRSMELA